MKLMVLRVWRIGNDEVFGDWTLPRFGLVRLSELVDNLRTESARGYGIGPWRLDRCISLE